MQKYIRFRISHPYSTLRLVLYYSQRILTSRRLRRVGTYVLVHLLGWIHPLGRRPRTCTGLVRTFRRFGYLPLASALTRMQCDEIHAYLADKSLLDNRGTGRRFELLSRPVEVKLGDYELKTVIGCPHVLETANRHDFLNLATEYLGFTPTITNISLRWSFPTDSPAGEVQSFHRDSEVGSFKILVYLTDVDTGAGPHIYVPGSHHDRMPLRLRLYSDNDIARDYGASLTITGAAGTAFAIDTKGIHKGVPPMSRPRLLLGIQYSLLPCPLYDYDPIAQKTMNFDAYINRLILRKDKSSSLLAI
jgi:hypothetical protein